MSKKHENVCMALNYIEQLFILFSAITECVSVSSFVSLVLYFYTYCNFCRAYYKTTDHRPPSHRQVVHRPTDHRPTDRSSTDQPTTDHRLTGRSSTDPPTTDNQPQTYRHVFNKPQTYRYVFNQLTDHRPPTHRPY